MIRAANPWPGVEVIYAPNDDDVVNPPPRETLRLAIRAARIVADRLAQNKKVLTTCWEGRNRSGLVSAMGLVFFLGIPGEQAAKIVQLRRRNGLRNPVFVDLLSRLRRKNPEVGHLDQAVLAKPPGEQAHLHGVPALWTPKAGLTLPPELL